MFTYSELESQTKRQLLALIEWYNLGRISKYSKKSNIIDFILEKAYKEEPQMSVRIRRIRRSSK